MSCHQRIIHSIQCCVVCRIRRHPPVNVILSGKLSHYYLPPRPFALPTPHYHHTLPHAWEGRGRFCRHLFLHAARAALLLRAACARAALCAHFNHALAENFLETFFGNLFLLETFVFGWKLGLLLAAACCCSQACLFHFWQAVVSDSLAPSHSSPLLSSLGVSGHACL